jgi:signal transduction histidine kinase
VLANRYSLEEVFLNLIVNARDAIDEARAAASDAGRLLIHSRLRELDSRPAIGIDIVDDGAGIPPEVMERLFEPFQTTKSPDRGTGLGLAIARAIVREFGGQIDLQPNPARGATATVVLPVMSSTG